MNYSLKSRISLAGAQSKIGLYLAPGSKERAWFLPRGAALSTHILKACNSVCPNETVNEAICLRAARLFEIDTPDCFLIRTGGTAPILVMERYDREIPSAGARHIGGLAVPRRLHQVDACQASGLLGADFKYEPSGVSYLNRLVSLISEMSPDPYQDRISLVYRQLFHFMIGNADNHLKNWSFYTMRIGNWWGWLRCTTYSIQPYMRISGWRWGFLPLQIRLSIAAPMGCSIHLSRIHPSASRRVLEMVQYLLNFAQKAR